MPPSPHPAVLIVNTRSRRGQRLFTEAKESLSQAGLDLTQTYPVRDPSRVVDIVQDAVGRKNRLVVVGGGDGTLSSVVGAFAHKEAVLGIIPMGTANNFARALGIPLDVNSASGVIASGKVGRVDLGKINDDYFTNAISLGISASLHGAGTQRMKRYLGRLGYLLAATARFSVHRAFRVELALGDRVIEKEVQDLRVANGPFNGGVRAVEGADVRSGELLIRAVTGGSKWALARTWARIEAGRELDDACVELVHARSFQLDAFPRQSVSVDGEVVTLTPVRLSLEAEALRVMVP